MKKTIIGIVIVIVAGLGIYYITSNNNGSTGSTYNSQTYTPPPVYPPLPVSNNQEKNTNPVSKTPAAPTPASVTVSIKNFSFNPATLNIKKGTKVTWTNNDSAPHTVTSDSGNLFDSGTLSTGQSFSFTFVNLGSINYHCAIHPMMQGVVVVQN